MGFFADKNDILIKNIFGLLGEIQISDGDIKLNLEDGIKLKANFISKFDFDKNLTKKHTKFLSKFDYFNNIEKIKANLNNNLILDLDKTYKVKNYDYNISGKIEKGEYKIKKIEKNNFINEEFDKIYLSDFDIKTKLKTKNISLAGNGKYSFNKIDFYKLNIDSNLENDQTNLDLDLEYGNI